MIRVLLVDDEPLGNTGLRVLLAEHGDLEIAGEALGGREAITLIRATRPDLVFLDVQMPEIDGFGVLRAIGAAAMPTVIFVTAYDAFAVRAFDVRALDYLLKPVAVDRLARALDRAREALSHARNGELERRLRALLDDRDAAPAAPGAHVLVRIGRRDIPVPARDIDWIEADDYCVILHARGRRHVMRATLGSLLAGLDPAVFARIHRSTVVNLTRVRELRHRPMGRLSVVLTDGTRLAVSRGWRAQLTQKLSPR